MAVDSTLFQVTLTPATYPAGVPVPLGILSGSATVRDGYGTPKLKRITRLLNGFASGDLGIIRFNNTDWDTVLDGPAVNAAASQNSVAFDKQGIGSSECADAPLRVNSVNNLSWIPAIDTTVAVGSAVSVYALVEIDYPKVPGVTDTSALKGKFPQSISVPVNTLGSKLGSPVFTPINTAVGSSSYDFFKAGRRYLIRQMSIPGLASVSGIIFMRISQAAGQGGLQRIIPINTWPNAVAYEVIEAETYTKGPITLDFAFEGVSATPPTALGTLVMEFLSDVNGAR